MLSFRITTNPSRRICGTNFPQSTAVAISVQIVSAHITQYPSCAIYAVSTPPNAMAKFRIMISLEYFESNRRARVSFVTALNSNCEGPPAKPAKRYFPDAETKLKFVKQSNDEPQNITKVIV